MFKTSPFDYFFEGLLIYYNLEVSCRYFCKAKLNKKKNAVKKSEALECNVLITDGRYVYRYLK